MIRTVTELLGASVRSEIDTQFVVFGFILPHKYYNNGVVIKAYLHNLQLIDFIF